MRVEGRGVGRDRQTTQVRSCSLALCLWIAVVFEAFRNWRSGEGRGRGLGKINSFCSLWFLPSQVPSSSSDEFADAPLPASFHGDKGCRAFSLSTCKCCGNSNCVYYEVVLRRYCISQLNKMTSNFNLKGTTCGQQDPFESAHVFATCLNPTSASLPIARSFHAQRDIARPRAPRDTRRG